MNFNGINFGSLSEFIFQEPIELKTSSSFGSLSEFDFQEILPSPSSSPKKDYSLLIHGSYEYTKEPNGHYMDIAGKKVNFHSNYHHVNLEHRHQKTCTKLCRNAFHRQPCVLMHPLP